MTTTLKDNARHPDPARPRHSAQAAVIARGLHKSYGRRDAAVVALDGVDVAFAAGRFTAIMGPSGSGKSTLMHCLAGLDTADSGSIVVGTTEISQLSERELTLARRDRIGFVFQAFNLVLTLTAEQNILLPLDLAGRTHDAAWLAHVVGSLGLGDRLGHRPHELSGGQQQRVAVARALVTRPEVIFADEPTGNLDSAASAEVLGLLVRCTREFGQTVIMVTHDVGAASHADRVVIMRDGRVVGDVDSPTPAALGAAYEQVRA